FSGEAMFSGGLCRVEPGRKIVPPNFEIGRRHPDGSVRIFLVLIRWWDGSVFCLRRRQRAGVSLYSVSVKQISILFIGCRKRVVPLDAEGFFKDDAFTGGEDGTTWRSCGSSWSGRVTPGGGRYCAMWRSPCAPGRWWG